MPVKITEFEPFEPLAAGPFGEGLPNPPLPPPPT
jgi:hypothetical protein